jgi:hypothetical protein
MDGPFSFHNIDQAYKNAVQKEKSRQTELANSLCASVLRKILEDPLAYPPDQAGARNVVCDDFDELTPDGRIAFEKAFVTYGWRVVAVQQCTSALRSHYEYRISLKANA